MPLTRKQLVSIFALYLIGSDVECVRVDTKNGPIEGTSYYTRLNAHFYAFLKIPYAEPPEGSLRFKAPVPKEPWTEVYDATEYGPMCMQVNLLSDSPVDEDCLHLNVFTHEVPVAANHPLRPVVVYIHGGAFQLGSASDHKPHLLMERDVVLVTLNYRLGAFGFLSLAGSYNFPGNIALKDQVLALKWVKDNIASFGGDPRSVTLMGNSAGAFSVTAHMVSPMTRGLFHRVIAFSGAVVWQKRLRTNYSDLAYKLAAKMDCPTTNDGAMMECLQKKPASDFNRVDLREYPNCTIMTWFPVIEEDNGQERFLVDDPVELFRNGSFEKVPVIIGRTRDEFVDIPYRMINTNISHMLNENFDEIAPFCFFYEESTKKSKHMSQKLKKAYFRDEPITNRSLTELSHIFSDGWVGWGVHRLVHLISNQTKVYYYELTFIGQYSFFKHPHNLPYGVHHSDEIQYVMETVFVGPRINYSDSNGNKMVERMTRIVEQFAEFGNPNNHNDQVLKDMNWPTHDLKQEFYLDIGWHLTEKQGLALDRYAVWDELEASGSDIRQTVFGSASAPPRGEWTRTGITYAHHSAENPFGLRCPKNATRGLQSVIQAFIIKYFIFDNRPKEKSVPLEKLLRPTESEQTMALWNSISEILWNVGEKTKTFVCLPGDVPHISHSHAYFQDNVTEKLWIFEFNKLEDLQIFIKRYIFYFTDDPGPGALVLLYSAVWTRGCENVRTDLDSTKGAHLMGNYEEGSLNIVTLLISGRATPYLHNGVVYVGDEDHYALPQFGILCRSRVGLMIWDGEGMAVLPSRQPGSRLKTPGLPIWVTSCMGHYGIIFNSNRELLRNYHAEKRFELHHYTCAGCFVSMTVDNRGVDDGDAGGGGNTIQRQNSKGEAKEGDGAAMQATPIEKLIHTKWSDSKITFLHPVEPAKMNL